MEYANRKFRNNRTGEIVKVIDAFENIAILENKQKVDIRALSDPSQYTEEIDPSSFFNNQGAYNVLAEKIKNIPTHMMQDDPEEIVTKFGGDVNPAINESAIVMTTEEDEMAELARKYGVDIDNSSQLQKQQQSFAKILGDDSVDLPVVNIKPEEPVMRVDINRDGNMTNNTKPVQHNINTQTEDPIVSMFKRAKRNIDFSVSFEINNKIPRLDFIEMMEDSYDTSIIDFLSDEFTKEVINNPDLIKESIKSKIKEIVYGVESFPTPVNPQITDAVTQVEKHEPLSIEKEPVLSKDLPKKTTRKPRAKKESVKND